MRRTFNDVAALAARVGVGSIFFANGWHKLEAGLVATGAQFGEQGAPAPAVWAAATMLIELLGGALLIAGFAVPACGILLFAEALAVFAIASGDPGLPLTGGDTKLIIALGAASILLAVVGAGRLSVDHMVVIRRRESGDADDFIDPDAEADAVIAALREPRRPTGDEAAGDGPAGGARPGDATTKEPATNDVGKDAATKDTSAKGGAKDTDKEPGQTSWGRKGRSRRADPGSTTESRSEAPLAAAAAPSGGERGDRLVADGR
ncbi:MAG TPA: DoxX family protein, partial [Thermopolyspora sp.]